MTTRPPIDPELRILLQEIAHDPKARLFRTPIPRPERLLLTGIPPTGQRAPGLTSAERELLRVYREDMAKLLRDAAEWKLQQDPIMALTVSKYDTPHLQRQFANGDELLSGISSLSSLLERRVPESPLLATGRLGESMLTSNATTPSQFAGLSLRLTDHDAAWIHIGREMIIEDRIRPALECLSSVVRRGQSRSLQASALSFIGCVFDSRSLWSTSSLAFSAASQLMPSDLGYRLSTLVDSSLAQEMALARSTAAEVDSGVPVDSPGLMCWINGLEQRRSANRKLCPSAAARRLMLRLKEKVGLSSRLVLNATL